jgi:cytochrome c oxidase cbb3-type subunit 3
MVAALKMFSATIKNGVVEKGMPAWGKSMKPEAVRNVAFFVMSLQGTNPQNAKAPQGEIFKETTEKPDSTKVQASL